MTKKALFVSIDGMTDQLGQSQVLPYLCGLRKKGFEIEICSCEKPANLAKNQDTVAELLRAEGIQWHYCIYETKVPVVSQRKNFKKLSKLVNDRIEANQKKVFLHCRSYLPGLIGLTFKTKYKVPFIFDMRGFWADERIDGNIWKLKNPVQRNLYAWFKKKEKEMLQHADHVVTLTHSAKREIGSWNIPGIKGITVIPCCADLDHFRIYDAKQKAEARSAVDLQPQDFVVGYLGALGTWYMLDEMLDFCAEAMKVNERTKLFFVTNDNAEIVLEAAEKKGIPSDRIHVKAAKRQEVPECISCFDIGLFFIRPLYSKKGSSPTKLAELLGCGIPVVTNKGVGDVDEIIGRSDTGICVEDFTAAAYKEALKQLPQLANKPAGDFRAVSETMFSLQQGIEKYQSVYSEIITI
jgi:glycosyltransferase involved in cell wall biosynthesis